MHMQFSRRSKKIGIVLSGIAGDVVNSLEIIYGGRIIRNNNALLWVLAPRALTSHTERGGTHT